MHQTKSEPNFILLVINSFIKIIVFLLLIFWLAGRWDYWQGWVFFISILLLIPFLFILFKDKPDLAKERMRPGPGIKSWDIIFWVFYASAFLVLFILAPLDAGRFRWSGELPVWAYVIGYIAYLSALILATWPMYENEWFSSVVRIQKDRGQKVVQTGPYRYVRHPGYVGAILMGLGMPIVLGSLWSLIPGGFIAFLIIIRTYLEDKTLQKELPGYKAYTKKVKYRLTPGLW